tara:strand:- start:64 stop:267 length:204 start_codon:yes stop_codon:yes gene_type:complete
VATQFQVVANVPMVSIVILMNAMDIEAMMMVEIVMKMEALEHIIVAEASMDHVRNVRAEMGMVHMDV